MAYELSRSLYRHVFASAEQHILACLRSEDEQAPEANASFLARFGGLL